jgi:hypothetical protein
MAERPDPVQPGDAAACAQARNLLAGARFGALAFTDAETGTPGISRIALGLDAAGGPVTLISSLRVLFKYPITFPKSGARPLFVP